MKKYLSISALMAGALALGGCNNNEPSAGGNDAQAQGSINFSVGQESPGSRTQYSPSDWLQIEWIKDVDDISIFCAQTQTPKDPDKSKPTYRDDSNWEPNTSSTYTVSSVEAVTTNMTIGGTTKQVTTNSKGKITLKKGEKGLYWGKNQPSSSPSMHTFYAGYGKGITIEPTTGVAKCQYETTQTLEKGADGAWVNMNQAYMVAYKQTLPTASVALSFRPIMTTLVVEVMGEVTYGSDVSIESMEITIPQNQDKLYTEGGITYFNYTVTANGGDVATPTTTAERTIKFNLPSAQTVMPGSSIKLTAILPPIAINSTDKLTIKVNATGDVSNKAIFAPATAVTASQKVMIATANWNMPKGAVDLGLPSGTLWASCNLGATKPEEYGDYYGWGCIEPYTNYKQAAWEPYFTAIGGSGKEDSDCGTDNDPLKTYVVNVKSISGTEWDAAKHKLGDKWRMPTYEEMGELINSKDLYWSIDNLNGVKGYKITSYITGNYIFLPYAGSFQPSDPDHKGIGKYAHYWVARSSAKNDNTFYKKGAINLSLDNQEHIRRDAWRYFGFSIRPVYPSKES